MKSMIKEEMHGKAGSGMQEYRDAGIQEYRDARIKQEAGCGMQEYMDAECGKG